MQSITRRCEGRWQPAMRHQRSPLVILLVGTRVNWVIVRPLTSSRTPVSSPRRCPIRHSAGTMNRQPRHTCRPDGTDVPRTGSARLGGLTVAALAGAAVRLDDVVPRPAGGTRGQADLRG